MSYIETERKICVTCQLSFNFSEGCYISINDVSSMKRVWSRTLTPIGNLYTEQRCTHDLIAGNYTVTAYDMTGVEGQFVLVKPVVPIPVFITS